MSRPDRAVSYAVVLRTPGAPRTFTAATLARLFYGTLSLSLLLTVQAATGSFAVAGAAVGVFGIPGALLPLKSRWIDRYGRRRVLGPLAVSYTTALLIIAGLDASGTAAPLPYLAVSAVAGLLTPPVGPVMRSIWAALAPGPAARQRAYTLDAVVEETVFTISPLLVGVLITTTRPVVALIVTALLALVGALGLATSTLHGQLPPPQVGGVRRDSRSPLRSAPLRWVLLVMLTAGVGLSLIGISQGMTHHPGRPVVPVPRTLAQAANVPRAMPRSAAMPCNVAPGGGHEQLDGLPTELIGVVLAGHEMDHLASPSRCRDQRAQDRGQVPFVSCSSGRCRRSRCRPGTGWCAA